MFLSGPNVYFGLSWPQQGGSMGKHYAHPSLHIQWNEVLEGNQNISSSLELNSHESKQLMMDQPPTVPHPTSPTPPEARVAE